MFNWILSRDKKYYFAKENTTIRADLNFNVYGGGGGGETTTTSHTYYYYKIKFPHNSMDASQIITFYDATGSVLYNLPPYYEFMNYGEGILSIPGSEENSAIEGVSTATYYVFYSADDLIIDYENAQFHISKNIIRSLAETKVTATFEYIHTITPIRDIASVIDGRWDTQVQTQFFAQPPQGYNYAILDLGATKTIQALDIVAGFFKPDDIRRYDIEFSFTLQSSTDNVTYTNISDETKDVRITGGEAVSFEEKDLRIGFQARYIKLVLDDVKQIQFGTVKILTSEVVDGQEVDKVVTIPYSQKKDSDTVLSEGLYVVAITEIAVYNNIILKSEAKLIGSTKLTVAAKGGDTSVSVSDTSEFDPSGTVYIESSDGTLDSFTYTNKTSTSFTGVQGISSYHSINELVTKDEEGDSTLYDRSALLPKLGDRLYKETKIDDNLLYDQSQLDYVAKSHLKEFSKNHDKITVNVAYAPHIQIGHTIKIIEPYNNKKTRYFVGKITDSKGFYTLVLERFPADQT